MTANPLKQDGVGMIEAMVALIVMSIGMLGIAALYIESTRANRTALVRTQAVYLVNDMADRIRANRRGGNSYDTTLYGGGPTMRGCVAGGANCTPVQLAEDDLARWITDVRIALPKSPSGADPTSTVQFFPAAGGGLPERYQIIVTWREPGELQDFSYTSNVQLIP